MDSSGLGADALLLVGSSAVTDVRTDKTLLPPRYALYVRFKVSTITISIQNNVIVIVIVAIITKQSMGMDGSRGCTAWYVNTRQLFLWPCIGTARRSV